MVHLAGRGGRAGVRRQGAGRGTWAGERAVPMRSAVTGRAYPKTTGSCAKDRVRAAERHRGVMVVRGPDDAKDLAFESGGVAMTIFVSHDTAAECWRSGRFDFALGGLSIRPDHRPAGESEVDEVATLLAFDRLSITYAEAMDFSTGPKACRPMQNEPGGQEDLNAQSCPDSRMEKGVQEGFGLQVRSNLQVGLDSRAGSGVPAALGLQVDQGVQAASGSQDDPGMQSASDLQGDQGERAASSPQDDPGERAASGSQDNRSMRIGPAKKTRATPTAQEVAAARKGRLAFATEPLHVLVPGGRVANSLEGVARHVRSSALPSGSFLRGGENLLISSPEFCFVQMAASLEFPLLVKLGFELCSLYTVQPNGVVGYWRVLPPTTDTAIKAYLDRCGGMRGVVSARKAIRYVATASGSPMETVLACILCLPARMGGYGLPLPRMNYRIERIRGRRGGACDHDGKGVRGGTGDGKGAYYLCDLYWPDVRLDVEYDSDQEHTGSDRIAADAIRRNELAELGVATITATRRHIRDAEQLDLLAGQIAHFLGHRLRKDRSCSLADHVALRKLLTGF